MHAAIRASVDEAARAAAAAGIDAQLAKGGTVALARSSAQWTRARAAVAHARSWDRGEDDLRLLDRTEALAILRGAGTSARRTPQTARRCTPGGWCAAWPPPWSSAASRSTSRPE